MLTLVGPRNHGLDGFLLSPYVKGQFLRQKSGRPGNARRSIHTKRLSRGQNWHGVDADWGVLDGVHIGATWRIRLNRPRAAAMQPYVKLL